MVKGAGPQQGMPLRRLVSLPDWRAPQASNDAVQAKTPKRSRAGPPHMEVPLIASPAVVVVAELRD